MSLGPIPRDATTIVSVYFGQLACCSLGMFSVFFIYLRDPRQSIVSLGLVVFRCLSTFLVVTAFDSGSSGVAVPTFSSWEYCSCCWWFVI